MHELAMSFSEGDIRAILHDEITMTYRRVSEIRYPESHISLRDDVVMVYCKRGKRGEWIPAAQTCRVSVGDIAWVREPWSYPADDEISNGVDPYLCLYKVDDNPPPIKPKRWMSPLNMSKRDARIWLEITDVRCKRIQSLTDDELLAMGFDTPDRREEIAAYHNCLVEDATKYAAHVTANMKLRRGGGYDKRNLFKKLTNVPPTTMRDYFAHMWNKNIPDEDFDANCYQANPWIWVVTFKRTSLEELNELIDAFQ